MRRLVLGFAFLGLLSALVGCQGPCYNCNGGRSTLFMGKHRAERMAAQGMHGGHGGYGLHGGNGGLPGGGLHYRPPTEPAGGPVGQYAYPYYTLRGPRDFLVGNPPSIGPY